MQHCNEKWGLRSKIAGICAGGFVYILCPNNKKYIYKKLNRLKLLILHLKVRSTIIYNNFKYIFNEKILNYWWIWIYWLLNT